MKMQHILTYGLSRSPTLANFQKMPVKLPSVSELSSCQNQVGPRLPVLIPIHDGRYDLMHVRARADEEEEGEQE